MKSHTKYLLAASIAVTPLMFLALDDKVEAEELGTQSVGPVLTPIELLGKHIFFDEISRPANKQSCASCHAPAAGWTLPNSVINSTTVVSPGAMPHRQGGIKAPANAYASFSPVFQFSFMDPMTAPWRGGNLWDGRAEGYGASAGAAPQGDGGVSATVTLADLPVSKQGDYQKYLGPTADQALNPFPNPAEENVREHNVCLEVSTSKYRGLYEQAYGEPINCRPIPESNPAYLTSYKRIAVALAAWQSSADVNSFSSRRDTALKNDEDGKFPLDGLTDQENLGHDIFYGQPSALNKRPDGGFANANCFMCHNGVPKGEPMDRLGVALHQLYTDNRYRNIGVPYNREIPGVAKGDKQGLKEHVSSARPGEFRTPTLRNVSKGVDESFTRAYTHNGWFKSLESLVHFYNTRDVLPMCEAFGIVDATEMEALAYKCWPVAEFLGSPFPSFVVGNLGLTADEEAALVAYMKTFSDEHTPEAP